MVKNVITQYESPPDDLMNLIQQALEPLKAEICQLRQKVTSRQDFYTVAQLAEKSGFSKNTVYQWIQDGRVLGNGKRIKLAVTDNLTDSSYRIRHEAWEKFLSHFPNIAL